MSTPLRQPISLQVRLARAGFTLAVDLQVPGQGITVLYGASGSGKTTLLRCVAGLERADTARIRVNGQWWQCTEQAVFLPPHQRELGYVFQEASLLPHLSVQGNLAYGVQRAGKPGGDAALAAAIELLGIGHLLQRSPGGLSGGERQRVAIARALATQPQLLLLDEPLAAIDAARRQEILPWLETLRDELSLPMLYVTHAPDEVARLANHVVVLSQGRVTVAGDAAQVMGDPTQAIFTGDDLGALVQGHITQRDTAWHLAQMTFDSGSLWVKDDGRAVGSPIRLRILARDVSIATQAPQGSSIQNSLPCSVLALADDAHPSQLVLQLACGHGRLLARITRKSWHALGTRVGDTVWAQVKSVAVVN
jgi:molybdate transport system ATP-binding protein